MFFINLFTILSQCWRSFLSTNEFDFHEFHKNKWLFISLNHCYNYKLDLWQNKNIRVCLLESETREWFKCVGHLKNTSTLDCVQTFYFIMWSLHASTCFVSKISISANSKVPCLYHSVLQLYHRLLTVEQTHKISKLVTRSLSLLHTYQLIKSVLTCMFYASAVNKIGRLYPDFEQPLTIADVLWEILLNFVVIHVYSHLLSVIMKRQTSTSAGNCNYEYPFKYLSMLI